jgi:hypothetical protein
MIHAEINTGTVPGSAKPETTTYKAGYDVNRTVASVFTWIPGTNPVNVPNKAPAILINKISRSISAPIVGYCPRSEI